MAMANENGPNRPSSTSDQHALLPRRKHKTVGSLICLGVAVIAFVVSVTSSDPSIQTPARIFGLIALILAGVLFIFSIVGRVRN